MSDLKLIWKPEVFLVGVQAVREDELKRFLASRGAEGWTTDAPSAAEKLVEVAGRVCYESFKTPRPGGNAAYVGHILESKHGNVLEHAVFNFIISGVSRSLTHELIRHRAGVSVSQLSQRYVDSRDVAFVVPPALIDEVHSAARWLEDKRWSAYRWLVESGGPDGCDMPDDATLSGLRWLAANEVGLDAYIRNDGHISGRDIGKVADRTLRRKRAREASRSSLPPAAETVIFVTANARALRNIFEQRGSIFADAEIRRLSAAWAEVMKRECPNLFGDVRIVATGEEIGVVSVEYPKV